MTLSYIQVTTTAGATTLDQTTTQASISAEASTTDIVVQWGSWGDWSEWAPTCYDDSSTSIYKDSDKYYPKRSRTRDCIKTDEYGTNTIVAVNDASGECPYEGKLEKEKDANHATGCFQQLSTFNIFYQFWNSFENL